MVFQHLITSSLQEKRRIQELQTFLYSGAKVECRFSLLQTDMPLLIVIGYVWPEPASSAAGSRMLSLIELYLQQGWQVMFASAAEKSQHRFRLDQWGVVEHQILLNDSSFDQWLATENPQAVLFDRFMLEEQFGWRVAEACPQAMRILDMEDCHALRYAREQCVRQKLPLQNADLNNELALREIAAIYRCDVTLVISEYEMQLLQQHYQVPSFLLCYTPFLVKHLPKKSELVFAQRQHFIAIGNFRHAPNWHAVLWLKEQLWPLIRQQLPDAQLHIYGAYPPPKATALHNPGQGFLVKGWVADAAEVMQQARVCLAPLAFGAGLKGKLLDAMCHGTPSVTTPVGAEGMQYGLQWAGLIARDSTELVAAAVRLYQDAVLWQQAQQTGFEIVSAKFSYETEVERIWPLLEHIRQDLAAQRAHNFTGKMLQHHAYRSTKFMGQWIEVKQRLATLQQPDDQL